MLFPGVWRKERRKKTKTGTMKGGEYKMQVSGGNTGDIAEGFGESRFTWEAGASGRKNLSKMEFLDFLNFVLSLLSGNLSLSLKRDVKAKIRRAMAEVRERERAREERSGPLTTAVSPFFSLLLCSWVTRSLVFSFRKYRCNLAFSLFFPIPPVELFYGFGLHSWGSEFAGWRIYFFVWCLPFHPAFFPPPLKN